MFNKAKQLAKDYSIIAVKTDNNIQEHNDFCLKVSKLVAKKLDFDEYINSLDETAIELDATNNPLNPLYQKEKVSEDIYVQGLMFEMLVAYWYHVAFTVNDDVAKHIGTPLFTFLHRPMLSSNPIALIGSSLEMDRDIMEDRMFEFKNYTMDMNDFEYSHLTKAERNAKIEPIRNSETDPKIQRNELCPCGSGKKFKKCCR